MDWELSPDDTVKYRDTLRIIERGIASRSLRYVVIYTQSPSIEDIVKAILHYFSEYRKDFRSIEKILLKGLMSLVSPIL